MTKDKFKITGADNLFVLTMKRKPNWFMLLLTGVWVFGLIGITATVIYGLLTDSDKLDGDIVLFMALFILIGLFVLKIFLWHLRGKEKIVIKGKELWIIKVGTILTIPKKYEISLIDNFTVTDRPTTPHWIRFWGLGGGRIQFDYLDQIKYFGQTLTKNEAIQIIDKLNKKISTMV